MINKVKILRLGRVPYRAAYRVQDHLVSHIKENISRGDSSLNFLILLEHPPVYTTGIRSKEYSVHEEERLKNLGADFVRSNRGGLITFHGPGQLVAYPILDLNQFIKDSDLSGKKRKLLSMKWYIETLEEVIIQTLKSGSNIEGFRSPHTGVWVNKSNEKKICAMGVHNSDLVTSHGLALNCDIDL